MMYPIALDLTRIRIALAGSGEAARRRLEQLRAAGATQVTVYDDRLPGPEDIRAVQVLMAVGFDNDVSAALAATARGLGVLVNVEDKPEFCDFHFMSHVARGDLTLAISTAGKSPTLAQQIKAHLGRLYGEEWAAIVSEIGERRLAWKREGLTNQEVGDRTREWLRGRGLFAAAPQKEAV